MFMVITLPTRTCLPSGDYKLYGQIRTTGNVTTNTELALRVRKSAEIILCHNPIRHPLRSPINCLFIRKTIQRTNNLFAFDININWFFWMLSMEKIQNAKKHQPYSKKIS